MTFAAVAVRSQLMLAATTVLAPHCSNEGPHGPISPWDADETKLSTPMRRLLEGAAAAPPRESSDDGQPGSTVVVAPVALAATARVAHSVRSHCSQLAPLTSTHGLPQHALQVLHRTPTPHNAPIARGGRHARCTPSPPHSGCESTQLRQRNGS